MHRLAELTFGAARKKIPALIEALDGTFTDHHAFMCRHYLDQIDHLDTVVAVLDTRIALLMGDHDQDIENLDTIPEVGRRAAEIIIAETGGDMTAFVSAANLASSIGVSPGMNESAGVAKSGHTRGGNGNLKRVLAMAAMAAVKQKNGVYYRRVAARRGRQGALVAVMHKLTVAVCHILHDKVKHKDLGADYFAKRDPERAMRRMVREANSWGMTVRFDPIPAAA